MTISIEDNDEDDSRTAKAVAICETARTRTGHSLKLNWIKQEIENHECGDPY
jgi:hypothetical protein